MTLPRPQEHHHQQPSSTQSTTSSFPPANAWIEEIESLLKNELSTISGKSDMNNNGAVPEAEFEAGDDSTLMIDAVLDELLRTNADCSLGAVEDAWYELVADPCYALLPPESRKLLFNLDDQCASHSLNAHGNGLAQHSERLKGRVLEMNRAIESNVALIESQPSLIELEQEVNVALISLVHQEQVTKLDLSESFQSFRALEHEHVLAQYLMMNEQSFDQAKCRLLQRLSMASESFVQSMPRQIKMKNDGKTTTLAKKPNKLSRRPPLTNKSKKILRQWYVQHFHHPYPSDEEKARLSQLGEITIEQVSNWFINTRVREWKPQLKKIMKLKDQESRDAFFAMSQKIQEPYLSKTSNSPPPARLEQGQTNTAEANRPMLMRDI